MTPPDAKTFAGSLLSGDTELIDWLRSRCERVAGPQFSSWAWNWIREDFTSDLIMQLTTAAGRDTFHLRGDTGAYLDTAIRNLCRSYFRELARTRLQSPIEIAHEAGVSVSGDTVASILAVIDIRRALGGLSPICRELIESKYVYGHSLAEMGARQGVEEKTVRSRLHTCRERLRELWRKLST